MQAFLGGCSLVEMNDTGALDRNESAR